MTWEAFSELVPARILARIIDLEIRQVITHKTAVALLELCLQREKLGKPNACNQV